jgi:hypothetical protein
MLNACMNLPQPVIDDATQRSRKHSRTPNPVAGSKARALKPRQVLGISGIGADSGWIGIRVVHNAGKWCTLEQGARPSGYGYGDMLVELVRQIPRRDYGAGEGIRSVHVDVPTRQGQQWPEDGAQDGWV